MIGTCEYELKGVDLVSSGNISIPNVSFVKDIFDSFRYDTTPS